MPEEEPRSLQQVVPVCDRVRCTDWMELDSALRGSKGLYGRVVDFFPALFRSSDRPVNMNKARDWWKKREHMEAMLADPKQFKYSTASQRVRHQFVVKALGGRGRRLGEHWDWLYPLMLIEFRRLRRAGVKKSNQLVAEMGVVFIEDREHHVFNDFLERYNIVYRRHKGKKQVSEDKQMMIDKAVARHLGNLKRQFQDGLLNPEHQYNRDESHFVIDLDDGKTLDFVGAQSVKYRSIVSGREDITMCVLLKGGSDALILCPMLIFKNKKSSYPILNLPDTVAGVCYGSSPTAFINGRLMTGWLQEPRCWGHAGPFTTARTMWMYNASGHCGSDVEDTARELRTTVRLFPANAKDKVQPADRFPIQRIKEHWRRLAERRNIEAIRRGDWKVRSSASGKLSNPGKKFFLNLAAECIQLVNEEKDRCGVNWAKKLMIQCGLDVPSDGVWKVDLLSRELNWSSDAVLRRIRRGNNESSTTVSL